MSKLVYFTIAAAAVLFLSAFGRTAAIRTHPVQIDIQAMHSETAGQLQEGDYPALHGEQ